MAASYVIKKSKDGQFYFHLQADGILLSSEMYKAKSSAKKGIASMRKNSAEEGQYDRRTAKNGKEYFVLKAKNHEIIGTSPQYDSAGARDAAIRSAMKNGPSAAIDDQSKAA